MFPGGNMAELMQQAQQMQAEYERVQEELKITEVTASSGGGLVSATITGDGELRSIHIDPKAVDPEDVESLEDMVVAAVQAANADARKLAEEKLGPVGDALGQLSGGFGGMLGG